jgi:hypothetical protein
MTVAMSAWHTASATPAAATAHGEVQSSHPSSLPADGDHAPGALPLRRSARRVTMHSAFHTGQD